MMTDADPDSCKTINDERKYNAAIKCRFYDQNAVEGTDPFSIKDFQLKDVMVGGLHQYFSASNKVVTSDLELFLIIPEADFTDEN